MASAKNATSTKLPNEKASDQQKPAAAPAATPASPLH
jgi:hypothetical protein